MAGAVFSRVTWLYDGLRRDSFGSAGFLYLRSANLVQSVTLLCLAAEMTVHQDIGRRIMTNSDDLHPNKTLGTTTFSICGPSRQPLFRINPDIPIESALEHASASGPTCQTCRSVIFVSPDCSTISWIS